MAITPAIETVAIEQLKTIFCGRVMMPTIGKSFQELDMAGLWHLGCSGKILVPPLSETDGTFASNRKIPNANMTAISTQSRVRFFAGEWLIIRMAAKTQRKIPKAFCAAMVEDNLASLRGCCCFPFIKAKVDLKNHFVHRKWGGVVMGPS
jgi:hypothetical protein